MIWSGRFCGNPRFVHNCNSEVYLTDFSSLSFCVLRLKFSSSMPGQKFQYRISPSFYVSIWNVDGFYRPLLTSSLLGVIVRCRFSFFWSCEIFCRLWLNSSHFSFCKSTVLVTKKIFFQNWPKISLNRFFFLNFSSELDSEQFWEFYNAS